MTPRRPVSASSFRTRRSPTTSTRPAASCRPWRSRSTACSWDEAPSLYGVGAAEVFVVRLDADGGQTVEFGDGEQGARLPTGRRNVTGTYRVGGGTAGEVESSAISSLLGSVRGVKKVEGAGPTSGGADQDDERDLRALVPGRARAFGRAVSIEDLVDLSRGYPGVTHAAAWTGSGPPGCACGGSGLHLAFLRAGPAGPRAPDANEIGALASFLDARRDATVPLCVCAAVLTDPAIRIDVALAVDPRRDVAEVVAATRAALARSRRSPRCAPARAGAAARPLGRLLRPAPGRGRRRGHEPGRAGRRGRCRAPAGGALRADRPRPRPDRRRGTRMSAPPVAAWLPPALRETPDGEPDAPRLLDLLLAGVDEQRRVLEQDIDAVWDDFFIESCADWAVPYIGALLGLPLDAGRSRSPTRSRCGGARERRRRSRTSPRCSPAGRFASWRAGRSRCGPSGCAIRRRCGRRPSISATARAFASARRSSACAAA